MKKIISFTLLLTAIITIASCGGVKTNTQNTTDVANDTIRISNDSLEYEIIIIEPGFNQWLVTQPPRGYYEQFWLENRNIVMATNYNRRVINPTQYDPNIYLLEIDYRQGIDYGYEVNYLLYNWFEFFQDRYKQKLR